MLEKLMTSEELKSARVSQAYFGRLVGVSKMRVSQLIKAGLLMTNGDGVLLIASLKNWYQYQAEKNCYSLKEFVRKYVIEPVAGNLPDDE